MADESAKVAGSTFDVAGKYQLIKRLGEGSYGVVVSAKDKVTGKKVAIKKMGDAIDDAQDAKRVLRELRLLRHFRGHENCITIRDIIISPPELDRFKDVYIVTDLMDTDLHRIIRSPQPLSDDHTRYFLYQILRGLKFIHSANVLHRDLKPNNLLVNANCDLKICDLGLARMSERPERSLLTCYVVTRWYRAPELLLGTKNYTKAIDIWSVGCILAELLGRKALFPGKDYVDMLKLIVSVLGNPETREDIPFASEKAIRFLATLPRRTKQPWDKLFPKASPEALDLLSKMLEFNPAKRIDAAAALAHPYMAELHDPMDEPTAASCFDFGFEKQQLTTATIRELIFKEVQYYRRRGQGEGDGDAPADAAAAPAAPSAADA